MFAVAASQSRIKRLYIYDWTGGNASTRFDAGLTDTHHNPRPGYVVVCRQLRGAQLQRQDQRALSGAELVAPRRSRAADAALGPAAAQRGRAFALAVAQQPRGGRSARAARRRRRSARGCVSG